MFRFFVQKLIDKLFRFMMRECQQITMILNHNTFIIKNSMFFIIPIDRYAKSLYYLIPLDIIVKQQINIPTLSMLRPGIIHTKPYPFQYY